MPRPISHGSSVGSGRVVPPHHPTSKVLQTRQLPTELLTDTTLLFCCHQDPRTQRKPSIFIHICKDIYCTERFFFYSLFRIQMLKYFYSCLQSIWFLLGFFFHCICFRVLKPTFLVSYDGGLLLDKASFSKAMLTSPNLSKFF